MKQGWLVLVMVICILGSSVGSAEAVQVGTPVVYNGESLGSDSRLTNNQVMVPLTTLNRIPDFQAWLEQETVYCKFNNKELSTKIGSNSYRIGDSLHHWSTTSKRVGDQVFLPLRMLLEALGSEVYWDSGQSKVVIKNAGQPDVQPTRMSPFSQPLRAAFTHGGNLWLFDARDVNSKPEQITTQGRVQLLGWSPDGKWLLYEYFKNPDSYSDMPTLWVLLGDGKTNQCLDTRSIVESPEPQWSPDDCRVIYQTIESGADYESDHQLRLAELAGTTWSLRDLAAVSELNDYCWAPDGNSLAISINRTKTNPPLVESISLSGLRQPLFSVSDNIGKLEDGLYINGLSGLKFSPNGRYMAFFRGLNSASTNADSMNLQVMDLQTREITNIGEGLGYRNWIAWSPDSSKVAGVLGYGREASTKKSLVTLKMDDMRPVLLEKKGTVETKPIWVGNDRLLGAVGPDNTTWEEIGHRGDLLVPGQQIWSWQQNEAQVITTPKPTAADIPISSFMNDHMVSYIRLQSPDQGTLCIMDLNNGMMAEIISNVDANPGFYGNYRESLSIYWLP